MTLQELGKLRADTLAERDQAAAIADNKPEGSYAQRVAAKDVERLEKRLSALDAKRVRFPSLRRHPATCWCDGCLGMGATTLSHEEEGRYTLQVIVPASWGERYKSLPRKERTAILDRLRDEFEECLPQG